MHMKTSSKYVFLTYYIYFSSFLPFILLISWYRWRSCANCALSERIAHFFHSSLSLSLSALSLSVLALSSPFISNPSLSPFTISLSSCLPPKQRVVTNVRVVAVFIKLTGPSESTLPTVKVANE